MNSATLSGFPSIAALAGALIANYWLDPLVATVIGIVFVVASFVIGGGRLLGPLLGLLAIPGVLIVLGFAASEDALSYDAVKDGWYFLNPAIALALGYLVARSSGNEDAVLLTVFLVGLLFAVVHLAGLLLNPEVFEAGTIEGFREEVGAGYFNSAIAIIVALCIWVHRRDSPVPHRNLLIVGTAICALSVVLAFSRTMWLAVAISIVIFFQLFNPQRPIRLMVTMLLLALFFLDAVPLPFSGGEGMLPSMIAKLRTAAAELWEEDFALRANINYHWRAYEALAGLDMFDTGTAAQAMLGQGFGALVDLGFYMPLGGEDLRYIPILHNGAVYLLLKVGTAGLVLYFAFLGLLYLHGWRAKQEAPAATGRSSDIVRALALVLFFATFAITGMFNKFASVPLMSLLGSALYFCFASVKAKEDHAARGVPRNSESFSYDVRG